MACLGRAGRGPDAAWHRDRPRRLVGHPAEIVASAREAERNERHFEHAVEECKRLCDVAPERLWLGTHADLAVRLCAVVDARERLGIPVYGALIGVPADDSTAGDWRRRFAGAWRTLGFDRLRRHRDALTYAI